MRILIVNAAGGEEWRGGVERGIALASSLLNERGVEVRLLQSTPSSERQAFEVVRVGPTGPGALGRRVRNRLIDFTAVSTRELDAAVVASGADVVHTHNLPGITTAVWDVARRNGIPIVHSLHDYYLLCPRASLMNRRGELCGDHVFCRLRTARLGRWSDAVSILTGVSNAVLDAHEGLFPLARREVLRNPMVAFDRERMRPPTLEPLTVGYLGGLTHEKGVEELLGAVEQLRGDTRFDFRIGGHGRLMPLVQERAAQLGNLTFDGVVRPADKRAFIDRCDLGIIPSVWAEPGGPTHVLAEWLTAGRPALVSPRGGLGEVAGAVGGAIPVEPSSDAIVGALLGLARPERWAEALAARGAWDRDRELDAWIGRQVDLYGELLGRASRTVPALM
jgi:glycosyltransferase involved in cell wall biosynthesis